MALLAAIRRNAFPELWIWACVAAVWLVDVIWAGLSERISIDPSFFRDCALYALSALAVAAIPSPHGELFRRWAERARQLVLFMLFAALGLLTLSYFNQLVMTIRFPLADDLLLSWDRALGIDWHAYARWATRTPEFSQVLWKTYGGLLSVMILVVGCALIAGRRRVAAELCGLYVVSAVPCMLLASAFPALTIPYTQPDPLLLSKLSDMPHFGAYHVSLLLKLRNDASVFLTNNPHGLSTFPSFHLMAALLVVYACRGNLLACAAAAAFAVLTFMATPIYGGHYFVDMMGGTLLLVVILAMWRKYGARHVGT